MESKTLRFDLYSWKQKRYNELLEKADELVKIVSRFDSRINIYSIYLKDDGEFGPVKFVNTCVPDSFMMALFICYIQYDHIASLFNSFVKLRAPMVFLRARMYNEAKASWLFCCNVTVTENTENYVMDAWSNPKDHLHMFDEFILGNDKLRAFELQFLLMTRKSLPTHMIVGLNHFDRWILYDNSKLRYDNFNPKNADFEDFTILLIGYVNIPQDNHRREGR
ncbi:uncharacterized protein LOC122324483 isoform X2 [Puntigrus tetrazona]|uniref:uncharacterized protein LOC122324483 isoform X2 n=1 Tax=Puntigrus tetrazona TaxID=1606681 RepID=UPI001C8AA3CC|nr:uncharacterized protein LOC122324483 isoform X2 [Puntigrus tetrazona]